MQKDDKGRRATIIYYDGNVRSTATGNITQISDDGKAFRLITDGGNEYNFSENEVTVKFKGGF